MVDWIKQGIEKMVPHPEMNVPLKLEVSQKTEVIPSIKGSPAVFLIIAVVCNSSASTLCHYLGSIISLALFFWSEEAPAAEPPPAPKPASSIDK